MLDSGGYVVDYHTCEFFPERWFDLVLVLRADTEKLYDRLVSRNYVQKKLDENMECEIMQVVLESARESYPLEIVQELPRFLFFLGFHSSALVSSSLICFYSILFMKFNSNTVEDVEDNIQRVCTWYQHWISENS